MIKLEQKNVQADIDKYDKQLKGEQTEWKEAQKSIDKKLVKKIYKELKFGSDRVLESLVENFVALMMMKTYASNVDV